MFTIEQTAFLKKYTTSQVTVTDMSQDCSCKVCSPTYTDIIKETGMLHPFEVSGRIW